MPHCNSFSRIQEFLTNRTQHQLHICHVFSHQIEIKEGNDKEIASDVDKDGSQEQELEVSKDFAEEKLSEVISLQKPQNKKKSTIITLILLLINIGFMIFIISGLINKVGEQNIFEYMKSQGSKLWWLVGGIVCYALYMFSQAIMFILL